MDNAITVTKRGTQVDGMGKYLATNGQITIRLLATTDARAAAVAARLLGLGLAVLQRDYPHVVVGA